MSEQIILHAAVFGASFLQAAAGIGFGVIAGPIILIVMGDGAAIQVSILLSFLNAAVLAPGVFRAADRALLKWLLAGSLIGAPLGAAIFKAIDVSALKVMAAAAVTFMAVLASGWRPAGSRRPGTPAIALTGGGAGVLSGAMNAALAMPGPVVAALMSSRRSGKDATRATILILFVCTYPVAFAFQLLVVGQSDAALSLSLLLVPATLVGVITGRWASGMISERQFRRIIVLVLVATAIALLISTL